MIFKTNYNLNLIALSSTRKIAKNQRLQGVYAAVHQENTFYGNFTCFVAVLMQEMYSASNTGKVSQLQTNFS